MTQPMTILKNSIKPSSNMKLFGLTCRGMLLIVICLTRANLKIRTYPDLSLQIKGFLMGGCLYIQVGRWVILAMVRSDGVTRILVLPSSTIRFWLREVRRSLMCQAKIVQVYRYSIRILVRFLFVVPAQVEPPQSSSLGKSHPHALPKS